jgi:peptidoglycan/xylan/chitin deacetylase (PgdA/CDA1 family)
MSTTSIEGEPIMEPYDYSPLPHRPPFQLPGGARVAVWFGLNVEHYAFGQPALSLAPFTAQLVPDPAQPRLARLRSPCRRLAAVEMFARHGITPSAITNAAVLSRYPQIVEHGLERSWAFVGHGTDNSTWHVGMDRDAERANLEGIAGEFRAAGIELHGWLGPALTSTAQTPDVLAELGFDYSLDWANDDQPYWLTVDSGRLLSLPYSSEVNDIPAFVIHHQTGEQFAQSVIDQFDVLHAEGTGTARVMGIGVHPFLVGQPFRAKHFERALAHIAGHDGVWLTTSDEIARWSAEQLAPMDTGHPGSARQLANQAAGGAG